MLCVVILTIRIYYTVVAMIVTISTDVYELNDNNCFNNFQSKFNF